MNTNKYQVWEGEMEAAGIEENGISFFSAIFSAILGIVLLVALVGKTMLQLIFKVKSGDRKKLMTTLKHSELNMSVS